MYDLNSHSVGYEEFSLLGYNAVYYIESQLTFRRNMLPPFSQLKSEPGEKPT
jgi:hypothetical protein